MLQRIWSHGRSYTGAFAVGLVLLLGTNGLALWIPWLLRDAIHGMEAGAALAEVASYALAIVAVAIVQAAVRTLSRLTVLGASRKVVYDVRERFFAHLQRLGATFYDANRTGDIMSRGVNDLQLIRSLYGPGLLNLFNTAIIYVATMVLLVKIDFSLTLVSLSVFPFLFLAANRISKRVYARSLAVQEQLAVLSNRAQENLSGIQQVKIYAQEDRETEGFRKECDEFRRRNLAMAFLRGGMISMIGVVTGIGTLVVLFVGGSHVIEGKITFGDFVAFNAYLGLLTWPTIALGWIVNVFQRGAGALERIHSVLETVPDIPVDVSAAAEVPPVDGDIEIRGLSFAYRGGDGEEAPLLVGELLPDLVLIDALLEGCNGFELCRRLRALFRPEELPLVLASRIYRSSLYAEAAPAAVPQKTMSRPVSSTSGKRRSSAIAALTPASPAAPGRMNRRSV